MGHNARGVANPSAVIDSTTDIFKHISFAMPNVSAGTFNPANDRVYLSGRVDQRWGIFVLDGSTGELVMERALPVPIASSLAVSPRATRFSRAG